AAVLLPVIAVPDFSVIDTAPGELKVSVPKLTWSPAALPSEIEVPLNFALPLTVMSVPAGSLLMPPPDVRSRLFAVLPPVITVQQSSLITTAPAALNCTRPKLTSPGAAIVIDPPLNEALSVTWSTSSALSASTIEVPVKLASSPTVMWVPAASVIAPVEVSVRVFAVLVPVISIGEAALIDTVPAELNLSALVVNTPPPRLIDAPLTSVSPATAMLAAPASDSAPVELSVALAAVLAPTISMPESWATDTWPAGMNLSVPVLKVPPPRLIVVPLTSVRPVTAMLVALASEMAPVELSVALPAVLVPTMSMLEPSEIETAPVELKVSVPALKALTAPIVTLLPLNLAFPSTDKSPVLVTAPAEETLRSPVSVVCGSATLVGPPATVRFFMLLIGPATSQLPVLFVVSEFAPPPLTVDVNRMSPVPALTDTLPVSVTAEWYATWPPFAVTSPAVLMPAAPARSTCPVELMSPAPPMLRAPAFALSVTVPPPVVVIGPATAMSPAAFETFTCPPEVIELSVTAS